LLIRLLSHALCAEISPQELTTEPFPVTAARVFSGEQYYATKNSHVASTNNALSTKTFDVPVVTVVSKNVSMRE
jgi:hypothetical protein